MAIELQDVVYFIRNNRISKGTVVNNLHFDGVFHYYHVKTTKGVLVLGDYELYHTVDGLVDSIMDLDLCTQ